MLMLRRTFPDLCCQPRFRDAVFAGLPGFFPLGNFEDHLVRPTGEHFLGLDFAVQFDTTLLVSAPVTADQLDYEPESDLWNANTQLLEGKLTAKQAADKIQSDLDTWFKPGAASAATAVATMAATPAK